MTSILEVIDHPTPIINPGSLVFDIGANTGYIAHQFQMAGAGQVVCVEPCLKNFTVLAQRPGITPIHAAAWSCPTILPVSYCNTQSGLSSCAPAQWGKLFPEARYDQPEFVPTVTLDQLKATFGLPHLVKVDVEGAEEQVITAMTFKPAVIIFEYHVSKLLESTRILGHLENLGFTKVIHLDGELDIRLVPTTPIHDFIAQWPHRPHFLGNITAM